MPGYRCHNHLYPNTIPTSMNTTTTTTDNNNRIKSQDHQKPTRHITLDLIRKRSEHNESLVSNLQEIALHQEELEAIGPIIGRACGKTLKILLLQNNVISRLHPADMRHFKELEYLNLALNNIEVIEGIGHLEFLEKLDLTLNFIGLDSLEVSVDCLKGLRSLRELFMLGNPCMNATVISPSSTKPSLLSSNNDSGEPRIVELDSDDDGDGDGDGDGEEHSDEHIKSPQGWEHTRMYIIAKLPQLEQLDGTKIKPSERIRARQMISRLEKELQLLAESCRDVKKVSCTNQASGIIGEEEMTRHCPEDRVRLSDELAQQKAEKEANEKANLPKFKNEQIFEEEQREAIERAREREEKGNIQQRNEGRWHYKFDEDTRPGCLTLDIGIQKHLSSSLIDVDIHPTYISVVIKSKVLRLCLPAEVKSEASTAQRSTTTGHLLITMPKCDPDCNVLDAFPAVKESTNIDQKRSKTDGNACTRNGTKIGLQQAMIQEAKETLKGPVTLYGLVKESDGGIRQENIVRPLDLVESSSKRIPKKEDVECVTIDDSDDDEEPPPLL